MNPSALLYIILGVVVFNFVLGKILTFLNLQYAQKDLPPEVADLYGAKKLIKARAYQKANTNFSLLSSIISFVFTITLLATGSFGWFYGYLESWGWRGIEQGLVFFGLLAVLGDVLSIPFQLYQTFVIEEKFGFNRNTLPNFFMDKLKGYLLGGILAGGLMYLLLYLVQNIGPNFWWIFWLVFLAFSLFMNLFYTSWILPLFNKLEPLPAGQLREAIESYCAQVGFPLSNLFVMDGSKRSSKANAFFSGLGSRKKVVLFDTLIEKHSQEELVAVLAHEVGHYKKGHIPLNISLSALQTGIVLFILSLVLFSPELSRALGYEQLSIPLNLMAFSFLFSPVSMVVGLFFNILSRKNEYEADRYARDTYSGDALGSALKRLSVDSLSNLNPHPWYVWFHYSHPPVWKRLRALGEN